MKPERHCQTLRKRFALFLFLAILWLPACHSNPDSRVSNTAPPPLTDKSDPKEFVKAEAPLLALTHVILIDGTGTPARTDQTLLIQAGVIQSVGKSGAVTIPAGAKILDLHGYTLTPGLVGMH